MLCCLQQGGSSENLGRVIRVNKQEVKALRKAGVRICSTCFRTDKETSFYKSESNQCIDCCRAYMRNYREVQKKISPAPAPAPVQKPPEIKEQVTEEPKEYTEALELCERALLALKKSGRLMQARPDHKRGTNPGYATVGDILFAVHSESRRARNEAV